jgi:hypothetical protein
VSATLRASGTGCVADQTCRGVWAALEGPRTVSVDDLELLTEGDPPSILAYLNLLVKHDYVMLSGPRKSVSGDSLVLFRLIKRTGPHAPYENEGGRFVDPNAPNQVKQGTKWSLPIMVGPSQTLSRMPEPTVHPGRACRCCLTESQGPESLSDCLESVENKRANRANREPRPLRRQNSCGCSRDQRVTSPETWAVDWVKGNCRRAWCLCGDFSEDKTGSGPGCRRRLWSRDRGAPGNRRHTPVHYRIEGLQQVSGISFTHRL